MRQIIILDHSAAHYRKDVYEKLLNYKNIKFEIVSGRNYKEIKCFEDDYTFFNYTYVKIKNHTFYYLKGSITYILKQKADTIICTGFDPHLFHTIILFFIHRLILRKRFYWWSHGTFGNQGFAGFFFRKFFYKNSSGILSYSNNGKKNLMKMGIPERKIKVVNNAINKKEYGFLNTNIFETNNNNDIFKILFCGRITKDKKIEVLLKSLVILKKLNLFSFHSIIIGNGEYKDILIHLAKELNVVDVVEFIGEKYEEETIPYFLNADIFVYPGGIGLSLLQALSYGIPVLTSDNLAIHGPEIELLEPNINGNLCHDESPDDFVKHIIQWQKFINIDRIKIKQNCINTIEKNGYFPDKVYEAIIDFVN